MIRPGDTVYFTPPSKREQPFRLGPFGYLHVKESHAILWVWEGIHTDPLHKQTSTAGYESLFPFTLALPTDRTGPFPPWSETPRVELCSPGCSHFIAHALFMVNGGNCCAFVLHPLARTRNSVYSKWRISRDAAQILKAGWLGPAFSMYSSLWLEEKSLFSPGPRFPGGCGMGLHLRLL